MAIDGPSINEDGVRVPAFAAAVNAETGQTRGSGIVMRVPAEGHGGAAFEGPRPPSGGVKQAPKLNLG